MRKRTHALIALLAVFAATTTFAIQIERVDPTVFFPKPAKGEPLNQKARMQVVNPGAAVVATARVTVGSKKPVTQDLGRIAKGRPTLDLLIPDVAETTSITVELLDKGGKVLATKALDWKPQKKWTIFSASFSHQDLGWGDYPHRVRTAIRYENYRTALKFCRETEDWPDDAKFRYNIETSESIPAFIGTYGKESGHELAKHMGEGRISVSALHNTANTEQLGFETMARLFYMSGRHTVDMLGVPANETIQQVDVCGMTWPMATYSAESGYDYVFHGFNYMCMPMIVGGRPVASLAGCDREQGPCVLSIGNEPNFYWQGPDGQSILRRATSYSRHGLFDKPFELNPSSIQSTARVQLLINSHNKIKWPFSSILSQDGIDFRVVKRVHANRAKGWNEKYAWPKIRCAIFDDYFRAIEKEIAEKKIDLNTVGADENSMWSDQDYAQARWATHARRLNSALPTTEKLASVAQVLSGGGDQWLNIFHAYNRLLQYWEHTNGKCFPDKVYGDASWYQTELEEYREMVDEASDYNRKAFSNSTQRLNAGLSRTGEKNLVVFNPLPHKRSDIVRTELADGLVPVDPETGKKLPVQRLPDGKSVFIAKNIPATGYKVFTLVESSVKSENDAVRSSASTLDMENKFYKIAVDPVSGTLTSLFDKTRGIELFDTKRGHAFNEYLYVHQKRIGSTLNFNARWHRMKKAASVTVERGPVADVLHVTGKAGGVRALKQSVILYHDLARIDFRIWMNKSPLGGPYRSTKEAAFVALPLAVPNFTIKHQLPGCVAEPYKDQIEGSATCHHTIHGFTDLSNDDYGVTVCPVDSSLVCYGSPTPTPFISSEWRFNRDRTYPKTSSVYLYLLNNMFDCNIAAEQPGPMSFEWAIRSHAGGWQEGDAAQFSRTVQQPLISWRADGKNSGRLPASATFMTVEPSNVICSVIKASEANGRGYIIRLNETTGKETTATVSLPMLPKIEAVTETSLVEDDRKKIAKGNTFKVALRPFGIKTIRVTCAARSAKVTDLTAKAVADMQVELSWKCSDREVSHFNIYRDTKPDCAPTLMNFIGQSTTGAFSDLPRTHPGGWIRSCLAPETTYTYRVVPVDRANNSAQPSGVAKVTTLSSEQKNLPPVAIESVRPVVITITKKGYVNVLFRTSCEPDVVKYEVYRSDSAEDIGKLIGAVKCDSQFRCYKPKHGHKPLYRVKEFDHAMFADKAGTSGYYYRVRAVDAAGQKGAFSDAVISCADGVSFLKLEGCSVSAQSLWRPQFQAELALDGGTGAYETWISKEYGGGTKQKPNDVWWSVEFEKPLPPIVGVKITGDHRGIIPIQTALQVQTRENGKWKTIGEVKDAKERDITVRFEKAMTVSSLRVFVPAADLPKQTSQHARNTDGIVRIAELEVILPNGKTVSPVKLF